MPSAVQGLSSVGMVRNIPCPKKAHDHTRRWARILNRWSKSNEKHMQPTALRFAAPVKHIPKIQLSVPKGWVQVYGRQIALGYLRWHHTHKNKSMTGNQDNMQKKLRDSLTSIREFLTRMRPNDCSPPLWPELRWLIRRPARRVALIFSCTPYYFESLSWPDIISCIS